MTNYFVPALPAIRHLTRETAQDGIACNGPRFCDDKVTADPNKVTCPNCRSLLEDEEEARAKEAK